MINRSNIYPIHPFPARMAPSIIWDNLPNDDVSLRVLDPMAGSGTTLVHTRAAGHQAIGCDTDPLALLIARAWCSNVNEDKLRYRGEIVLERSKKLAKKIKLDDAYPTRADEETCSFIDFWFDSTNRVQLTALSKCISRIHNPIEKVLLWCAFSRLIITKMDAEQRNRHRAITEQLRQATQEIKKLSNGYAFRCPSDPSTVLLAAEFMTLERLCCPFLDFALEIEREGGPLWLRLTGREGVKPFLQAELGFE